MDKKTGKKKPHNLGEMQPAYASLKHASRSDQKDQKQKEGESLSRLKRKRLLKNGRDWH